MTQTLTEETTLAVATACSNCGKDDSKNMRRGRCGRCARHFRLYGIERPLKQADKGFLSPLPALHQGVDVIACRMEDAAHEDREAQIEPESQVEPALQAEEEVSISAVSAEQGITAETINDYELQRSCEEESTAAQPLARAESEPLAPPRRVCLVPTWTTAPARSDLPATQEVDGQRGEHKAQRVREVSTPLWDVSRQRQIYAEAGHVAFSDHEWAYRQEQATKAQEATAQAEALHTDPDVQWVLDLAAQGAAAVAQALQERALKVRRGTRDQAKKTERRQSKIFDEVAVEVQAQMRADRQAGMSYAKIDAKYGYTERKGHVAWTVCKAPA